MRLDSWAEDATIYIAGCGGGENNCVRDIEWFEKRRWMQSQEERRSSTTCYRESLTEQSLSLQILISGRASCPKSWSCTDNINICDSLSDADLYTCNLRFVCFMQMQQTVTKLKDTALRVQTSLRWWKSKSWIGCMLLLVINGGNPGAVIHFEWRYISLADPRPVAK